VPSATSASTGQRQFPSLVAAWEEEQRLARLILLAHSSVSQPKKLVVLDGNAHAQHIFKTEHSEDLMKHIVEWLTTSD